MANSQDNRRQHRRGMALFGLIAFITVCVLVIMAFSQNFLSGVVQQSEILASGTRAKYIAESAINEALLDFQNGMNTPGGSVGDWYEKLRASTSGGDVISYSFFPAFTEAKCTAGSEGIRIQDVDVSVWALKPINDVPYERCGILTITALVAIPRRTGGLFNRYVYRNVQRSYEFKQIQVTPPQPFGQWALFMLRWDYLTRAYNDYRTDQANFDQRGQEAELALQKLIDDIVAFLDPKVAKAIWAMDKLDEAKRRIPRLFPMMPCPICAAGGNVVGAMTPCWPEDHGWSSSDIQEAAEISLATYNLTVQDIQDVADTDTSVLQLTPLATVDWQPFRSNMSLNNPVVVFGSVSTSDFPMRFPPWPSLPAPPVIDPEWIYNWEFPDLSYLLNIFETWTNDYQANVVNPHQSAWNSELRRHEGIFHLLGGVPPSYSKFGSNYQYRRASWRFRDNSAFHAFAGSGGGLNLQGGYWINDSVTLEGNYTGMGSVACSGSVDIGNCAPASGGLLTVVCSGNISVNGAVSAALVAPSGTVRGGPIQGLVAENYHSGDLSVTNDAAYQAAGGDPSTSWVTISPHPIAVNILRKHW